MERPPPKPTALRPDTALGRWRRAWASSLRFRLWAMGLVPLLMAFPLVLVTLAWVAREEAHTLLTSSVRVNLAGSNNYLTQLRDNAQQQVTDLVKFDRLQALMDQPAELSPFLAQIARGRGLNALVLATRDGEVIAASTGVPSGTRLPETRVLQQARIGLANAGFEVLDPGAWHRFVPPPPFSQGPPAPGVRDPDPAALVIQAAAHLPLSVRNPDTLLIAVVLLNRNTALVEHMREVIFPVGALPDDATGMISLHLGPRVIAQSRLPHQTVPTLGQVRPPQVSNPVLDQGQPWVGTLETDGLRYMAGFSPVLNNDGRPIGMLGVAFPIAPYQQRLWVLLAVVGALLAATMLALSVVFLRSGGEVSHRLRALNDAMNAVRLGQRVRMGPPGRLDELGRLKQDFDELLATIDERDSTLRQRNSELLDLTRRLDQERQRLEQVIAGTRAGTWSWDIASDALHLNPRWADISGRTLDELQPSTWATWETLLHPDDLARSRAALQRHLAGEWPQLDLEVRLRHRDGHWVWVHIRGMVSARGPNGQPDSVSGTLLDITPRREAETERLRLLERLQNLSAHVPGALFQYRVRADGSTYFPYASDGALDVYGIDPATAANKPSLVFARIHPDDRPAVRAQLNDAAEHLRHWHGLFRIQHPRKGLRWIEGDATPQRTGNGGITWHGYVSDVTEQQQSRERLRLAASVYQASQEGIMITDAQHRIIDVNSAFTLITGYSRDEALGQTPRLLSSGRHPTAFYDAMRVRLTATGHWQGEIWNRRKNGEVYAELLSIAAVTDDTDRVGHYVAIFTDINHLKAEQQELDRLAHFDALTGVPNRRLLGDRLSQAIAHALRHHTPLTVCMMDLDGFKPVNDTHGHAVGDQLLVEIASRLQSVMRTEETVARLGGDEFVLIFRDSTDPAMFQRVLDTVHQPVRLGEQTVQVSASLGVTFLDHQAPDAQRLLREADAALYRAKQLGRNRYALHHPTQAP